MLLPHPPGISHHSHLSHSVAEKSTRYLAGTTPAQSLSSASEGQERHKLGARLLPSLHWEAVVADISCAYTSMALAASSQPTAPTSHQLCVFCDHHEVCGPARTERSKVKSSFWTFPVRRKSNLLQDRPKSTPAKLTRKRPKFFCFAEIPVGQRYKLHQILHLTSTSGVSQL